MTKVTEEATRTLCCSMLNPSNPVMLAGGPPSGTSRVTTAPTIRLRIGKAPKTQSYVIHLCAHINTLKTNWCVEAVFTQKLLVIFTNNNYVSEISRTAYSNNHCFIEHFENKKYCVSCKCIHITHLLTGVWRFPKRSRLLQGRMRCTVHIPVVKRPAKRKQVLIQSNPMRWCTYSFFESITEFTNSSKNDFSQTMYVKHDTL